MRRTRFCFGVALAAFMAGGAADQVQAQRPVVPRRELKDHDFRPDGAWRRRALRVRTTRAALMRVGQLSALNQAPRTAAATTAVSGTLKVPTLLVRPSNVGAPFPSASYQQTLFGSMPATGKPYSVTTYYRQLSNGYLTLTGSVLGWYTAPETNTYYEDGCNGIGVTSPCPHGGLRLGELFLSALTAANAAGTDWGQFDNDGPDGIPNSGDDDGYVDFVAFIHPDVDGACGNNPHIWSHRYVLSAITGTGQPYTTSTPAFNGGFIKVEDYIVGSGVGGSTACTSGRIMPIGTFAHETGHAFGLPDLYDTDGQTAGIGIWGLMGAGNYTSPDSPSRMEAWSLSQLGWIDVQPLPKGITVIQPVAQSHTAYVVPITTSSRDEYYLLENRQRLEADTALLGALYGMGPGVLVWHVDNDQIAAHGITADNRVNAGPIHGLELVQADGLQQLDLLSGGNAGDGGDPFPGFASRVRLSAQTTPRAADNEGRFVGFMLDRFLPQAIGGAPPIEVRYTVRPSSVISTNRTDVVITVGGIATTRFDDILVPAEPVQVTAPPIASQSPDGRQRVAFTRWSNGQPAAFSLLPGAGSPDTLTATYDRQFRVLVDYVGTGSVESSLPGVQTGAFRAETAAVRLRAVPAAGATFQDWSGDTTATDSVLVLSGAKAFDLTASFSVSPEVIAIVDAAKALMGGLPLAAQISVALDRSGNRNGAYDLGDFLAYLDRNHATLSPALLQKLLASEQPLSPAHGRAGQ